MVEESWKCESENRDDVAGVLIINAKRHKSSEFHKEKVEEKKGVVPRWKLEFLERKKKYEERKAVGGAAGKDEEEEKEENDDSNDDDVSGAYRDV